MLVSVRMPVSRTISSDMRDWVQPVSGRQSFVQIIPRPFGIIVTFRIIGVGREFPFESTSFARIDFILSASPVSDTVALLAPAAGESSLTILAFLSLRRMLSSRPPRRGVCSLSFLPPLSRVQTLA